MAMGRDFPSSSSDQDEPRGRTRLHPMQKTHLSRLGEKGKMKVVQRGGQRI